MSIEGAVADREALAEMADDILSRWVLVDDRLMATLPVSKGVYDGWVEVLEQHGGAS